MTSEGKELASLRRSVHALERRRDELATYLDALDDADEQPPAPPKTAEDDRADPVALEPWAMDVGNVRWIPVVIPLALMAMVLDGIGRAVVGALAFAIGFVGLWLTVRPARLTLDEEGLSVRYMGGPRRYRWSEVTDFHFSRGAGKVEIEVAGQWRSHYFGFPSAEQDREAQRRVRRWIEARGPSGEESA